MTCPAPDGSCLNLPGAVHVAHRCRGENCGRPLGLDEITFDDTLGWVHVTCTRREK